MSLPDLLNLQLKDPEIIELLEMTDSRVIYDFDRRGEGTPDKYHVSIPEQDLELVFDESQMLVTIFIDYPPGAREDPDVDEGFPVHRTLADALAQAKEEDVPFSQGHSNLFGVEAHWLRMDRPEYSIHYEYGDKGRTLRKVTLMTPDVAP